MSETRALNSAPSVRHSRPPLRVCNSSPESVTAPTPYLWIGHTFIHIAQSSVLAINGRQRFVLSLGVKSIPLGRGVVMASPVTVGTRYVSGIGHEPELA